MERLYRQCQFLRDDEKQIELLEACLHHVMPGKDEASRDLGWLALELHLRSCSQQALRKVQARMAKRLPDIANNPNIYSALFVRRFLIRNPQVGELQSQVIDKIIYTLFDMGIENDSSEIKNLAIDIFAIRYGCFQSERIVATIQAALKNSLISPDERLNLLPLATLGLKKFREDFVCTMLNLFSSTIMYSRSGTSLTRDPVFAMLEKALSESFAFESTLKLISVICKFANNSILPFIPRIVSMLVASLSRPTKELFQTMDDICELFGASSTFYKHFFVIFSAVKRPLALQMYGVEAANLLATIIRTSGCILKSEVLISVQRTILEEAIRSDRFEVYEKILGAFLSSSHETVPVPVHVVRNIIKRQKSMSKYWQLLSLCDAVARPRLQNLSDSVVKRLSTSNSKQSDDIENNIGDEENFYASVQSVLVESRVVPATLNGADNDEVMELGANENEEIEADPSPTSSPPSPVSQKEKMVMKKSLLIAPKSETNKRTQNIPSEVPSKKQKKKKSPENVKATILREGEASVDDIMSTFCL